MKKILYATDFSENAENAFFHAVMIAEAQEAELFLLNVYEIPTAWEFPNFDDAVEMGGQAKQISESKLLELLEKTKTKICTHIVSEESTSVLNGILSAIDKYNPDLLVVGTKGGNRFKEILFGSVTTNLIKKLKIPILAIPSESKIQTYNNIAFLTNLESQDTEVISMLLKLTRPFNPTLTILHIQNNKIDSLNESDFIKFIKSELNDINYSMRSIPEKDIFYEIQHYIDKNSCDLLVLTEKDDSNFWHFLLKKDRVIKIEQQIKIPILIYKIN